MYLVESGGGILKEDFVRIYSQSKSNHYLSVSGRCD